MERFKKLSERTAFNSDQREQDQAIIYSDSNYFNKPKTYLGNEDKKLFSLQWQEEKSGEGVAHRVED